MNPRLQAEYRRLFDLPDARAESDPARLRLVDTDGRVRTLVLGLRRPADWAVLSAVWRGVQADLDLPAPAIAVNGVDAFELWFSLENPVPGGQAKAFLQGLWQRYLADVLPERVQQRPWLDASDRLDANASVLDTPRIPAEQADAGAWSAFVAPDLAAVFEDEPVLDVPPGEEAQAELLSHLASIKPGAWAAALAQLLPLAPTQEPFEPRPTERSVSRLANTGRFADPRDFLHEVMNDASVSLALRVEAAKALLAHRGVSGSERL